MRLPMPGSSSASWALYKARLRAAFAGADPRVCAAFWLFGLINNVLYVIILTSALDLVGPLVPKSLVLLFDVVPSFLTKLIAPYFIHRIPYATRIWAFVAISTAGMLLIALTPDATVPGSGSAGITGLAGTVGWKMLGVMLASLSSGGGELSFLGLTHYYGHFALAAWGSGTGGAGLIGAGAYAVATTWLGLSVRASLLASSLLPIGLLVGFFLVLPRQAMETGNAQYSAVSGDDVEEEAQLGSAVEDDPTLTEYEGVLSTSTTLGNSTHSLLHNSASSSSFANNIRRARSLFFPYMLPLLLVYIAEYTINQGVAPTLLFPLPATPFANYRAFYPTYNAIYQAGVFISRSSTPFLRVHNLYLPSFLQVANLLLLTCHSLFFFIPSVWLIFLVVFWEGLLGGLVYVNTFAEITDRVPKADREFSLGATSVSDSGGICVAGLIGMVMEVWLCEWNVESGRPWCRTLAE